MDSKRLLESEDKGMVQLLTLKDVIDDIVKCRENESSKFKAARLVTNPLTLAITMSASKLSIEWSQPLMSAAQSHPCGTQ